MSEQEKRIAPTLYDFHPGIDARLSVSAAGPSVHIVATEHQDGRTVTVIVDVVRRDWEKMIAALATSGRRREGDGK